LVLFPSSGTVLNRDGRDDEKSFVGNYLRLWHPYRMESKVLDRVVESDREKVRLCALEIVWILRNMLASKLLYTNRGDGDNVTAKQGPTTRTR
jgi:hypothetical protein